MRFLHPDIRVVLPILLVKGRFTGPDVVPIAGIVIVVSWNPLQFVLKTELTPLMRDILHLFRVAQVSSVRVLVVHVLVQNSKVVVEGQVHLLSRGTFDRLWSLKLLHSALFDVIIGVNRQVVIYEPTLILYKTRCLNLELTLLMHLSS